LLELAPSDMESSLLKGCLPSTRQDILSQIVNWATDLSGTQNVLWLRGLAGSGKSTIAITIANFFRDLDRLGAFIFFDRTFSERSHPSKVVRTLAYKLGTFDPRIGLAIATAIDNYPSIKDTSLDVQFTKLIIEPLTSLPDLQTGGPIVLVFDALDECGNSAQRETLLEVLGTMSSHLPSFIRVLVISRPLQDITAAFQGKQNIFAQDLEVSSNIGGRDIVAYFKYHLGAIQRKKLPQQPDWPSDEVIRNLGRRSCGLFIWASTVAKFIDQYNPLKRLAVILGGEAFSGAQSALDSLYTTALEDAYAWDDDDFVVDFRSVLEVILVLQNPLTTSTLDQLIGLPEGPESCRAISALACVIADEPTVHLLHPSFADFLFSRPRCNRDIWYFNEAECHQHLAKKCLDRLSNAGLTRNLCRLTLSAPLKDEKVPDEVTYACIFWINHTCFIDDDSLAGHVETFLNTHLLHWFEAMSIIGRSRDTIKLLDNLKRWMMVSLLLMQDYRLKHAHRKTALTDTTCYDLCQMLGVSLKLMEHLLRSTHF
jgi:NACHT domain